MKYVALFLSAVVGGLVGAGAIYFAVSPGPATPESSGSEVVDSRADEVARVRGELAELRDRMNKLESIPPPSDDSVSDMLKEELLEAARTAARDEVRTVASTQTDAAIKREAALSQALEQLQAPHEDTRRNGIRYLRRMFAAEASTQVLPALVDDSALVRKEAAAYFEYLWDPAALRPLVELMHGDNVSVAEQALDALCKSGEEEAITELQYYYLKGPVLQIVYEAGKALEENNRTSAVPGGVQRFRDALSSTDPRERQLGVSGLGRWGQVSTDEWGVRALAADADSRVRTQVERTIAAWDRESKK